MAKSVAGPTDGLDGGDPVGLPENRISGHQGISPVGNHDAGGFRVDSAVHLHADVRADDIPHRDHLPGRVLQEFLAPESAVQPRSRIRSIIFSGSSATSI